MEGSQIYNQRFRGVADKTENRFVWTKIIWKEWEYKIKLKIKKMLFQQNDFWRIWGRKVIFTGRWGAAKAWFWRFG
mgnify:CR=1 FL=1